MLKTIVILNPAARSEKASGLGLEIERLAKGRAVLCRTTQPGEARVLARQAVEEGFERVVVAGVHKLSAGEKIKAVDTAAGAAQ